MAERIVVTGAGTAAANQTYTLEYVNPGRYNAPNGYYFDPVGFSGYGLYDDSDVLLYSSGSGLSGTFTEVTGSAPAPTITQQSSSQTPWVPTLQHPPPAELGFGTVYNGTGAPSATLGTDGDIYIDTSTGDIYRMYNNTWTIFVGGTGSATITSGVGDPTGVVTPTAANQLYFDTAAPPTAYRSTGTTNTSWVQII